MRSKQFDDGFLIGVRNSRGWTSRTIGAGGAPERELARQYREHGETVRFNFPKTGKLLKKLEEIYEWDADREDRRAEKERDLD